MSIIICEQYAKLKRLQKTWRNYYSPDVIKSVLWFKNEGFVGTLVGRRKVKFMSKLVFLCNKSSCIYF